MQKMSMWGKPEEQSHGVLRGRLMLTVYYALVRIFSPRIHFCGLGL
jgi:hypothetical protein